MNRTSITASVGLLLALTFASAPAAGPEDENEAGEPPKLRDMSDEHVS